MKKYILFLIIVLLPLTGKAETKTDTIACRQDSVSIKVMARVVDKKTGEPLPFASVYISEGKSTISNAVGEFSLVADPADVLRISYVGYYSVSLQASEISGKIELESEGKMLGEVVVNSPEHVIKKTLRRCKKDMKNYRKHQANFFYRQIGYSDRQCTTFLESFLRGNTACSLEKLELLTGRYVALANSATVNPTNFYTFAQIPMYQHLVADGWSEQIAPLSPDYKKFFYTEMEAIRADNRKIYVVYFIPRNNKKWTINSRLYIDGETFQVLKYEGETLNNLVKHREKKINEILFAEHTFTVNFKTDNGFSEVQSVNYVTRYKFREQLYEITGTMFNVGDRYMELSKKTKKRKEDNSVEIVMEENPDGGITFSAKSSSISSSPSDLKFNGNLINSITQQGVDKEFWKKNEIVRRTPIEQKAVEIFEHDNLFGVF